MSKFTRKFETRNGEGGSSLFVKIQDGQSVSGVFRGEVLERKVHGFGPTTRDCPGPGCVDCAKGDYPTFKFRTNLVVHENGALVAKIFEQGRTVYEMLQAVENDYDLDTTAVKISRKGSTKDDTTYSVVPLPPKAQPNANVLKQLEQVKLCDLAPRPKLKAVAGDEPGQDDSEEAPF